MDNLEKKKAPTLGKKIFWEDEVLLQAAFF